MLFCSWWRAAPRRYLPMAGVDLFQFVRRPGHALRIEHQRMRGRFGLSWLLAYMGRLILKRR